MRFELDGKEYQIRFRHSKGYRPFLDDQGVMRGADGTDCYIDLRLEQEGLWRQVAAGSSMVHPGDRFEKETGRKVSLGRALKAWGLPREKRRVVWEAYHGRTQESFMRDVEALERSFAATRDKFREILNGMPRDCGCWKCKGTDEPLPPCTCGKCALEELKKGALG